LTLFPFRERRFETRKRTFDANIIVGKKDVSLISMAKENKGRLFPQLRRALITGTGSSVPEKVLSNADLEKLVETSDEWITTRTGIKERRLVSEGQTTASLSLEAARIALQNAKLDAKDLDLIICSTITPEMVCPSTACFVQDGLKAGNCGAFDLAAACSGFTYGVSTASSFISSGQADHVMVIGAETLSNITDYTDRSSCILFGDGAGAVVLSVQDNTDKGVLYSNMSSDGSYWKTISCQAHGSRYPITQPLEDPKHKYLLVNGRETYQTAVRTIVDLIEKAYEVCGITSDDVAKIIPHQMNARIIESVSKRLGVSDDKMFVNIQKYGNTSAASIPIALDEALRDGHIKEGDLIVLVAFGAGLTWGINLIQL
jgi:3-oxoacyl-[acyl-carrier-protein] synthase-3